MFVRTLWQIYTIYKIYHAAQMSSNRIQFSMGKSARKVCDTVCLEIRAFSLLPPEITPFIIKLSNSMSQIVGKVKVINCNGNMWFWQGGFVLSGNEGNDENYTAHL